VKCQDPFFTIFAPGLIQAVRTKTAGSHVTFRGNFSGPVNATDLVKDSKDLASLVVYTWKKIFWLGSMDFCEWHHKWRIFRPPWSTSPALGPNRWI